jgi:hypothetical protein
MDGISEYKNEEKLGFKSEANASSDYMLTTFFLNKWEF